MTDSIDEFDYTDMLEADGFDDTPQGDGVQVVTEFVFPVIPSYEHISATIQTRQAETT